MTLNTDSKFEQPASLRIDLPEWIAGFAAGYPYIGDLNDRMGFVIEAARRNVAEKTGGPFAAAIFERESGRLVSLGVNLVTAGNCSILHAEIVAIALAQRVLGSWDLGAEGLAVHELVTSTEPCAMCLGAVPWSGVRRVVCGARDADARAAGFDEGAKIADWQGALEARGIAVVTDVLRDEAAAVLAAYARDGGVLYNAGSRPS